MYALPKVPGRYIPILRVDRAHPGLGIGSDVVKSLAGEFKPNLIHEIWCPVRLQCPGGYRKALQYSNLELQISVKGGILQ
jgi:hypothetical protein